MVGSVLGGGAELLAPWFFPDILYLVYCCPAPPDVFYLFCALKCIQGTSPVAKDIARGLGSPPSPGSKMWAAAEFTALVETPLA